MYGMKKKIGDDEIRAAAADLRNRGGGVLVTRRRIPGAAEAFEQVLKMLAIVVDDDNLHSPICCHRRISRWGEQFVANSRTVMHINACQAGASVSDPDADPIPLV